MRRFCPREGQGELEDASCAHTCEDTSAPDYLLAGERHICATAREERYATRGRCKGCGRKAEMGVYGGQVVGGALNVRTKAETLKEALHEALTGQDGGL